MAGYRDTSSFDPNAGAEYGPPLRPFTKWQWIGVAMLVVGALAMVAAVATRLASHQGTRHDWIPLGSSLVIFGSVLINSRRQPGGLSPEVKRQRLIIIAIAVAVMALAAIVAILLSKGA